MKKLCALILCLCLTLSAAAALADVDLTHIRENPDIFSIYEGDGITFITDTLTAEELSYVHAYESENRWSYMYFQLAVVDDIDVIYPLMVATYNADNALNIRAISFDVDGQRFTFDVTEDINVTRDELSTTETVTLFFGPTNIDFLVAMEHVVDACETADEMRAVTITAVLHGDEDLTVTLNPNFTVDFFLVIKDAFIELGGLDTLNDVNFDTPMTISEIPAAAQTPAQEDVTEQDVTDMLMNILNPGT